MSPDGATPPALPPDPPSHTGSSETTPGGVLQFYWFDGILEGSRPTDEDELHVAVARLRESGFGSGDVSTDGGRFTLLLDDEALPGGDVGDAQREAFVGALQLLVDAMPEGGTCESTLRCTEVFEQGTRESLFAASGGEMRVAARIRPHAAQDFDRDPGKRIIEPPVALNRRALMLLGLLFLVAIGLWSWQSGYLDRLFGASAESLTSEIGPFDGLLAMSVSSSWGKYVVEIRRGDGYPASPADVQRLLDGAQDLKARSAVNAVANGDKIWIRLEAGDGKVLAATPIELRSLVADGDSVKTVKLDGLIGAKSLRLAIDPGK